MQPKQIFGMPWFAVIGLGLALIAGVLSMMLPWWVCIFTLPLVVGGIATAVFAFRHSENLQFIKVMYLGKYVETRRVTSEILNDESA